MTLRMNWMKENMLCDSNDDEVALKKSQEALFKVKQSLLKLTVPDWYKNNNTTRQKILDRDTPIDYRQPLWKSNSFFMNSDEEINEAEKNIIESYTESDQNKETEQTDSTSDTSTISITKKPEDEQPKEEEEKERLKINKYHSTPISLTIPVSNSDFSKFRKSVTLPQISVSRKIDNINIVLPKRPFPFLLSSESSLASERTYTEESVSPTTTALISEDAFDKTQTLDEASETENVNHVKHMAGSSTVTYYQAPCIQTESIKSFVTDSDCHSCNVCACSTPITYSPGPNQPAEGDRRKRQTTLWIVNKLKSLLFRGGNDNHEANKSNNESRGCYGVITKTEVGAKQSDLNTSKFKNIVKVFKLRGQSRTRETESKKTVNKVRK